MLVSSTVLVGGVEPHAATSWGTRRLKISDRGFPISWSPRASKKNAPDVSPAQAKPALADTTPATWSPELKMYWSGVPLGQKPPPPTGEPANATHTSPSFLSPHCCRFT